MEFKRDCFIFGWNTTSGEPQRINVNKYFVSRTIARYRETGSVARRQESGPKKQQHYQKWFEK